MKIYNVSQPIVRNYIQLVEAKRMTIQEVPANLQEEVANILGISLAEVTLAETIEKKIAEMSAACEKAIINGVDVETSVGTQHFSLTSYDQADIKNWFEVAVTTQSNSIPYHADDQMYQLYTYTDIANLYVAAQRHILYHKTYFNTLKAMLKVMTSIDEVNAVTYGMELKADYAEQLNTILQQSEATFAAAMAASNITI